MSVLSDSAGEADDAGLRMGVFILLHRSPARLSRPEGTPRELRREGDNRTAMASRAVRGPVSTGSRTSRLAQGDCSPR